MLIDGPAGSGKTTVAARLAEVLADDLGHVPVAHADDMYEGWNGLPVLVDILVDQVLLPLSHGRDGTFQRWDWAMGTRAESILVPVSPVVVIEGVGVAQRRARRWASLVLWVDADAQVRLRRGLERDGEQMRDHWLAWQLEEHRHFVADGTRAAADVTIDTTATDAW